MIDFTVNAVLSTGKISSILESVEVTAAQRGVPRWPPSAAFG